MTELSQKREVHYAATIGFFDGVHLGHRYLIGQLQKMANDRHLQTLIITFDEHPRKVLNSDFRPQLLTSATEKMDLLLNMQVDALNMFSFTADLAALTATGFMKILYNNNIRFLLLGYDHHFGSDGLRNFADYQKIGQQIGIEVQKLNQYRYEGQQVSSSVVRKLLATGDIEAANRLLGYCFQLIGEVVDGRHIGRTIGFPTANLRLTDSEKIIPMAGVYVVKVIINHKTYCGMLNIGSCPTINGKSQSIEVHLLDVQADLYGQTLTVQFIKRLRDEIKFATIDELQCQLKRDKKAISEYWNEHF